METKVITPQNEPRPGGFPPRSPKKEEKPEKAKPAAKPEGDKK
jgi:hypothetical protein